MRPRLNILLGRAHTGKSSRIRTELKQHQQSGERAVLIVPEQYTFETERTLSAALGGLLGVQVLSFERLCERVLALSGQAQPFLSAQGLRMAIKRAALTQRNQLRVLGGIAEQAGFADTIRELIGSFKRAGISPSDLFSAAEKLNDHTTISDKLFDIASLYRTTEDCLYGRYITDDDALSTACILIPNSFIKGIPVYIDDIDNPNAQLYAVIAALIQSASQVTIALRVDRDPSSDADVFAPDAQILERLKEMAASFDVPLNITDCTTEHREAVPAIWHLEHNLFACPPQVFDGTPEGLVLFGASNRVQEVEALANAVLASAHSGMRYREMAVIASDMEAYTMLIERTFRQRNIPLFLDRKRPVTAHAATDAALSAARVVCGG